MKGAPLARRARPETTRAARKEVAPSPATVAARLRKGTVVAQKRLATLRTQGARWLKRNPGRAVVGALAGAFALGVTVTKAARRR